MLNCTIVFVVAFDSTDPYAESPTWTQIENDILYFKTKRGRVHENDRMEPGTARICLNNSSGNYWPGNSGGPYYGKLTVNKQVWLKVVYSGTTYHIFRGLVDKWEAEWRGRGGKAPVMWVNCVEMMAQFSQNDQRNGDPSGFSGYAEENSGVRVGHVLDTIHPSGTWPAGLKDIPVYPGDGKGGTQTIIAESAPAATESFNPINHLYEVEEAEQGLLFTSGEGKITFYGREALVRSFGTSQATFSNNPGVGEYRFDSVAFSEDRVGFYNAVRSVRKNGTTINEAIDAASITAGQPRQTQENQGLVLKNDFNAMLHAVYKLARQSPPKMRIRALRLSDASSVFPAALLEIPNRVSVEISDAYVDAQYHIQGIEHECDLIKPKWETVLQLRPLDKLWQLQSSAMAAAKKTGSWIGGYAAVHDAANADSIEATVDVHNSGGGVLDFMVERGVLWFDLTPVVAASVTRAQLWYRCSAKSSPVADFSLVIVPAIGVSNPLVLSDYGLLKTKTTSYGSKLNSETVVGWNCIEINATGLAYLWACTGGICELGLRIDGDISNNAPTEQNYQTVMGPYAVLVLTVA